MVVSMLLLPAAAAAAAATNSQAATHPRMNEGAGLPAMREKGWGDEVITGGGCADHARPERPRCSMLMLMLLHALRCSAVFSVLSKAMSGAAGAGGAALNTVRQGGKHCCAPQPPTAVPKPTNREACACCRP